jgi:hypothetical protein
MRVSHFPLVAALTFTSVVGCGAASKSTQPPPTYERWTLPPWEPPQSEDEEDPTAALAEMEGEWVASPEDESTDEGETRKDRGSDSASPEDPEGPKVDPNAATAPPSEDLGRAGPEGAPLAPGPEAPRTAAPSATPQAQPSPKTQAQPETRQAQPESRQSPPDTRQSPRKGE